MAYSAEISRRNPSCIFFLFDQSGSMADPFPGGTERKADALATIANRTLSRLVVRCTFGEEIRDYFHLGVIGYGGRVGPALGGALAGKELVPISELGKNPMRIEERRQKVEDGAGGLVEQTVKFPVWFDPVAENGTPMCQAVGQAQRILSDWLAQHPACFPPTVIHVTDGESTDGDPRAALEGLATLSSQDGRVILFSVHLSSNPSATEIVWPDSSVKFPDQYAQMLFDTASLLLPFHISQARRDFGRDLPQGAKAFVLNAKAATVIEAFDIGTRPDPQI